MTFTARTSYSPQPHPCSLSVVFVTGLRVRHHHPSTRGAARLALLHPGGHRGHAGEAAVDEITREVSALLHRCGHPVEFSGLTKEIKSNRYTFTVFISPPPPSQFLPIYFALSGLKTQFNSLNDGTAWGCVVLVCVAASAGKMGGCTLAARLSGHTWRESLVVGSFMNCKGEGGEGEIAVDGG